MTSQVKRQDKRVKTIMKGMRFVMRSLIAPTRGTRNAARSMEMPKVNPM